MMLVEVNPVPFTVSVRLLDPALMLIGLMAVMVGAGVLLLDPLVPVPEPLPLLPELVLEPMLLPPHPVITIIKTSEMARKVTR